MEPGKSDMDLVGDKEKLQKTDQGGGDMLLWLDINLDIDGLTWGGAQPWRGVQSQSVGAKGAQSPLPYQCGGWKGVSQGQSPATVTGVVHCQGEE
ncbi:hypothetical protein J6590_042969 [Homalodisca vitripennis]|nr:hypothetical protein J6590_042969 [Homalodisca vitripennis]